MYVITGRSGQYLINLAADGPVFSPMPTEAIHTHHAWMASSTAAAKLAEVRALFPDLGMALGLIELESRGPGQWAVVSTRSFNSAHNNETLIA